MIGTAMGVLKWLIGIGVVLWAALLVLDWIGPTVPAELSPRFEAGQIGEDVEAWLAAQEAAVPELRPDAAKRIVWAGAPGARTELAVVYLHGFSASREEARPLPDIVAGRLDANLFLTRLSGHGRDGAAMAEATVQDWVDDVAEAMAVGRRLGDRVILIGTSTGGTLAALAAARDDLNEGLAGVALISPNFRAAGWGGRVIEWPGAGVWGPLLIGAERGFEPVNEGHARHWTTRYPTQTLATLGALTRAVRTLNLGGIEIPALFLVSTDDGVIDTRAARRAAARWGGPNVLVPVTLGAGDDPAGHVLAGDILSPSRTAPIAERIVAWAREL